MEMFTCEESCYERKARGFSKLYESVFSHISAYRVCKLTGDPDSCFSIYLMFLHSRASAEAQTLVGVFYDAYRAQ